jgi:peptidoglycan hydrolase-like protein with peptidoglycan-binding domain
MEGPDVYAVQQRLINLGLLTTRADGIYGPVTEAAVRAFQSQNSLKADGVVGPLTWSALGLQNVQWGNTGYRISVDVVQNTLDLFDQTGRRLSHYPCATGKPDTPTPLGNWVIVDKILNPGGPFGTRWMRISVPFGGYGIHGTDNPSSIGQNASHGCIRLQTADVEALYDTVPLGTPVWIVGGNVTSRVLRRGMQGADVTDLQQKLQVLGFYRGDIDGVYGPQTEDAVRAFQGRYGLSADGIAGPLTNNEVQKQYDIALGITQP